MSVDLFTAQPRRPETSRQSGSRHDLAPKLVVLTGNPNCGKTTLFNALTGLRAKVANYAGVTVERKEGRLLGDSTTPPVTILDLPGAYSLSPQSPDEQIVRDVLFQHCKDVPGPDMVVLVVDASNLERNLYFATQVIELGYPTVIALNMMDVARANGRELDSNRLARELGVPVFPMVASSREGVPELRDHIVSFALNPDAHPIGRALCQLPPDFQAEVEQIARSLPCRMKGSNARLSAAEAVLILTDDRYTPRIDFGEPPDLLGKVRDARQRLEQKAIDWRTAAIEARYACVGAIQKLVVCETLSLSETPSDKLDRILTHKLWGTLFFILVMAVMFQSIFTLARIPTHLLENGIAWIGSGIGHWLSPGDLRSLLVDGVVAGVGAVMVFLPQICLLFLFIALLEDTGYMARAAFLMDRVMGKVGLHGKSFIPLLSSFACAVPGILAARTIEHPKDRLVTILIAPLMSCSARLPVYTLLIAACIPDKQIAGPLRLQGLVMLGLYVLGIVVAMALAWLAKKTLLKSHMPLMILELPPYRRPLISTLLRHMWERASLFVQRAGTVILGINILLWFLATYPRNPHVENSYRTQRQQLTALAAADNSGARQLDEKELQAKLRKLDKEIAGERLRGSFVGRLGRFIEPAIAPLGFDWKIGIGILSSFAARELFVSTMAVVYNVGSGSDSDEDRVGLVQTLREQKRSDGTPLYTTLTGLALLVFYAIALQCAGTAVVIFRETNSIRWALGELLCLGAIAWTLSFLTYQGGRLLGLQ